MSVEWLEQFESLDVIGNGSFGVIRKVRRKTDGAIFARKDLNFSLMSERDKRQIVAEVNILKDLHHEHIVRYHDRMVDRDAGTLYILMEFCGGGDLSSLIKRSAREAERAGMPPRGLDEEKVWNILMQLLRALVYCHHPNAAAGNASSSGSQPPVHQRSPSMGGGGDGEVKRAQILHRDLKPDNVFLDENDNIKLGDFGLSKALLEQASFASTYVGTPYYMSPELMQEKAYDNKSDIWSLGCLVYELCALKPPFHEARTHAELATFIKNGRIPPLPRGYSSTLTSTIKAMLNLNPAMRPSAIQLMQHERIDYAIKLDEITKAIANIKTHKEQVMQRERAALAREQALVQREADVQTLQTSVSLAQEQLVLAQAQIAQLQVALLEAQAHSRPSSPNPAELAAALAARDAEHTKRAALRDAEVVSAWEAREAELIQAVRARELEMEAAWTAKEQNMVASRELELEARTAADQVREKEFADAWRRREQEVYQRWQENDAENQARAQAREHEVTKAWEEREANMALEFEERLKLALQRLRDELKKKPSLADESFEEWHSVAELSGSTEESDAANVTVMSNHTTDDDTPKADHSKFALAAAIYKTPMNTNVGRTAPHFLKTPLPALSKGLFEASSPPSHAEPPVFAHNRAISAVVAVPGSAMRGVVNTVTGQPLETPGAAAYHRMFARPLRPKILTFGQVKEDAAEAEVEAVLGGGIEDATPQPIEKRASIAGISALRPKPSKDRIDAPPPLRRAKTVAPSSSARAGPSSPRKQRERSVSPGRLQEKTSRVELRRSPSMLEAKKAERPLVRTTTAPAVATVASLRSGRPSASGTSKKPRDQALVTSPKAMTRADAPVSSSSSSSVQPSGLSASDSSATSTDPDTADTAVPSVKERGPSRKSTRTPAIPSVPEEAATYDLEDEENLPSPFLKRVDRERFAVAPAPSSTASSRAKGAPPSSLLQPAPTIATRAKAASVGTAAGRRLSGGTLLRVAAARNATRAPSPGRSADKPVVTKADAVAERPAIANIRKPADDIRQRLQRV